jgi:hypothetical protein
MNISLSITYHDPEGRLYPQIEQHFPVLLDLFDGIAVRGSRQANRESLALFEAMGAIVFLDSTATSDLRPQIGRARREAIASSFNFDTPFSMHCDGDRILHWVEYYPAELAQIITRIPDNDFTVLGRTKRAFDTHPRIQRDTEAIVNHLFHVKIGYPWDVMIGARGMSRRAALAIVNGSVDDEISVDVTWPLYLRALGGYSLAYIPTEGLEFETHDRHTDDLNAAGGLEAWIEVLDSDIHKWLHRLEYVRLDLEAMLPFIQNDEVKS